MFVCVLVGERRSGVFCVLRKNQVREKEDKIMRSWHGFNITPMGEKRESRNCV